MTTLTKPRVLHRSTPIAGLIFFCVALLFGGTAAAQPSSPCSTYPIIVPEQMLQGAPPGAEFTLSAYNWGSGASGWLTWTGSNSAPTLAASLLAPGNVSTYVNPSDPADHQLDVGDWVQGLPGNNSSRAVRDNLALLLDQDIRVPTFVEQRGNGGQLDYRVARFITIRIVGLTVQKAIRFEYRGPSLCGAIDLVAASQSVQTSEGTPLPIQLGATGPAGLPLTYAVVAGPLHGTLAGQPPNLVYTPGPHYHGGDQFTFRATAGAAQSNVATVAITVTPVNDPPLITSTPILEVLDGAPYVYGAVAEDLDPGDVLTWSLVDAPPGMAIVASTGRVSWLPTFADVGQHVVTVRVTDSAGATDAQTFTLRVVHPAPIAIGQQASLDEDTSLAITLDGDSARPLTFVLVTLPQHGVLTGAAPTLVYTPALNYAGGDSFTFWVSDGTALSNVAAVSIAVTPINDPPRITTSPVVAASDLFSYRYWVVAEDVDPGDVLTFRLITAPAGMSIDGATGLIEWNPTILDVGTHPVSVEVRDPAGTTDRQDFVVTVVHPTPVAFDQVLSTPEDSVRALALSAMSPLPLHYQVVEPPLHGTLSGQAPALTYTPAANYHGPDRLTFRAFDGAVFSNVAAITIAVTPVNDPPSITSLPVLEALDSQAYRYAVTAEDVDAGDVLTFALVAAPAGMVIDPATGVVTWVPQASDAGTHAIVVAVTDLAGARAEQAYDLVVILRNRPPTIGSTPEPDALEGQYVYQVAVSDPDPGDQHTFSLLRPPGAMAIDGNGRLTWNTAGYAGNNRLPHTMCAAGGESAFGPPPAADVVAIVDESNSMRGEHTWLGDIGAPLEAHLVTNAVGVAAANRYGLAGFERNAHPIAVGGSDLGGHVDFIAATANLALGGNTEDGYKAIRQILTAYPLRVLAARNFILVTDEDRDVVDATLTYASTLAELTAAKVMLNVVVDVRFKCGDNTPALGMGQGGVGYVEDGHGGFTTCSGVVAYHPVVFEGGVQIDFGTAIPDYVHLALATGGAAWDLGVLRAGGLHAQSFTNAFLKIKVREILDQLPTRELPDGYVHSLRASGSSIEVDLGNRGLVTMLGTATANLYADNALVATRTVDNLAAGAHQAWSVPWTPAAGSPPSRLSVVLVPPGPECSDTNNQLAAAWVGVRATDRGGLFADQDFSLQVLDRNDSPQITSTPALAAIVERRYRTTVTAVDPDRGDGLAFSLARGPAGMTIHPRLGVIDYVPDGAQVGAQSVEVVVRDLAGAEARQAFTLNVGTTGRPPRFTSEPPWRAIAGIAYSYDPQVAADADAGLTFDAFLAPPGFHIDAATGHVDWLAPADFAGKQTRVLLRVVDGQGNYDLQQYILYGDTANVAPQVVSLAGLTAQTGTTYTYDAIARDPNAFEQLTWRSVALPPGATLTPAATTFPSSNANATVQWPDVAATHPARMEAPDAQCVTRDPSVTPLAPQQVWSRPGVNQAGQPVVGPIADTDFDGRLSSADLTAIAFVAASDTGSPSPRLHVLDARTGAGLWIYNQRTPEPAVQPAIASLDGSAQATILFVDRQHYLVALRGNGTLRWVSAAPITATELRGNAISVTDLEGDGRAEILIGPAVYGHDGALKWSFPAAPFFERGESLAIDVDGDGQREVLHRGELRDANGVVRKRLYTAAFPSLLYAFYAPLHLANDPRLYFVASERTSVGYALRLLDADGAQVWSVPGQVQAAGPIIVQDLTGDGHDDLYVASLGSLYAGTGQLLWHTEEHSIPFDGYYAATLADLDRDGAWEIISPRPGTVDIVAGRTGAVLRREAGKTVDVAQTAPLVDLDGQGDATLFVVDSQAVRAYRSARAPWPSAARVWQQRSLATDEMDDALRPRPGVVGQPPAPRYVINALGAVAQPTVFMPDLRVAGPSGDVDDLSATGRLTLDVNNRGTLASRPATVEIYSDAVRIGTVPVPALAPHQKVNLPLALPAADLGDAELRAVVVAAAADTECSAANNTASSRVMAVAIRDYGNLEDPYRWVTRVDERMVAPTITSAPPLAAIENVLYRHQLVATTPHAGDALTYRLSEGPSGATIDPLTGEITWTPRWGQLGQFAVSVLVASQNGFVASKGWTITVAASTEANTPPVISSTPLLYATVGQAYRYDVIASDAEAQRVTYRLDVAPPGMAIEPTRGIVLWVPATAADAVPVRVAVTDERGATSRQDFTLRVYASANRAPVIASAPPRVVNVGAPYAYSVAATDPDGDPLTYAWTAPAGAATAANALTWTPGAAQAGEHTFAIDVRDPRGGSARQAWTVFVNDPAHNAAPQITSVASTRAVAGRAYTYQVVATDGDGDPLRYALSRAPVGMSIDAAGLVRWTPALAVLGEHAVQVQVSDGRGGVTWQDVTLRVVLPGATNGAPVIASAAPLSAKVGRSYVYDLAATDPDGDPLAFTLASAPAGMSIHPQTGHLAWTPAAEGDVSVRVRVSDGALATEQTWTVTVVAANAPLSAQLRVAPDLVSVDEAVAIELVVSNAAGQVATAVRVDGALVALDGRGRATVRSAVLGAHTVTATISDGVDDASALGGFTVLDDSGAAGTPTVSIASPADGDSITAPRAVTGAVADDDLAGWRLQLADHGGNAAVTLASGVAAVDGALGTVDPSRLQNGLYTLTLRAWDQAGHEAKTSVELVVEGELKIGHFAVAFEDATVPLGGIPITVTRAYDTRRAHESLDFGYGWSVDYQAMRVQESRKVGARWRLSYQSQGLFGNWCVEPVGKPVVTVVLPDGKLEKFKPVAVPACNFLVPVTDVGIAFEALPGTHSTLEQVDYDTVRLLGGDLVDLGGAVDDDVGPADPALYKLRMPDGTAFDLDQDFGMRRVTDLDGNTVTFGANGIEHSSGVGIQFVRDAEGRIAEMRLPDGGTIRYSYNNAGELVTVADELARTTQFAYLANAAIPHYLRDIVDARGVRMSRSEYDASGRMVAHVDADGHRTEFATDFVGNVHTVRDALGHVTTLTFDPRGNVTREVNPLGEVTLHTYDELGNELSRTDGEGRVTRWTYDAEERQTSQTDALGQVTRWAYDPRGQIVSQTEPDGTVSMANQYHPTRGHLLQLTDAVGNETRFGYGASGVMTVLRRPLGEVTTYEHDYRGFQTRELAANGAVMEYTHDAAGRVLTETRRAMDAAGVEQVVVTTHTYDVAGQRLTTTDPLGRVSRTEYNAAGQITAEIDPSGHRTELEYDLVGLQVLTRYPDGTTERQSYDALGRQVASIDRAGRTTTMTYDAAGRLTRTLFADGAEVQTTYDQAGRAVTSVDARGGVTRFGYDAAGRQVRVEDPLGNVTTTTYTPTGRRASMADALGRTTKYVYDPAGKLTATLYPDLSPDDGDNPRTQQSYDALGRVVSKTDEMGRVTRYEYAVAGQLAAVVDAAGGRTEFTYDQRGNKVAQRDALGRVTRFEHDLAGQETARVLPGGQRMTRVYDGEGRLAREVDENGAATEFVYDAEDRVSEVRYVDGLRSTMTYTASGQVATVTDREGGVTLREYDVMDRLVRVSFPDGVRLDYSYDASGHRTSVATTTAAGARTVSYAFDAAGRMTTVNDGAGAMTYRYNAAGEVVELARPNGVRSEYAYDVRSRPAIFVERAANGNEVNRITYAVDRSGLRTGVSEQGANANRTISYQYDSLMRLRQESLLDGHPQGQRVTAWAYDAVGNRLAEVQTRGATSATVASTFDINDRLLTEQGTNGTLVTYAYDAAGQLTTRTEAAVASTSTTTYAYDPAHRLAGASGPAGVMSYRYDADGIRQSQIVDGVTTRFVVDPLQPYPQVIAELGGALGPAAETHYAIGLGGGTRLTRHQAGVTAYLHTDALGSLRLATTPAGLVAERWAYRAFGEIDAHVSGGGAPLPNTGPTAHTFLFTGEQYNPALNLYYLRARHYAPSSGRFTQADTFRGYDRIPLTLNLYAYAHNNPVLYTDPSGHCYTLSCLTVGVQLMVYRTAMTVSPVLYLGNRMLNRLGSSQLVVFFRNWVTDGAPFVIG